MQYGPIKNIGIFPPHVCMYFYFREVVCTVQSSDGVGGRLSLTTFKQARTDSDQRQDPDHISNKFLL